MWLLVVTFAETSGLQGKANPPFRTAGRGSSDSSIARTRSRNCESSGSTRWRLLLLGVFMGSPATSSWVVLIGLALGCATIMGAQTSSFAPLGARERGRATLQEGGETLLEIGALHAGCLFPIRQGGGIGETLLEALSQLLFDDPHRARRTKSNHFGHDLAHAHEKAVGGQRPHQSHLRRLGGRDVSTAPQQISCVL